MMTCKAILNLVSASAAIVAALLWFMVTMVKIPPSDTPDKFGVMSAAIISDGSDVIATAKHQNCWNRYAALAATVAALTQGIALLIPTD